MSPIFTSFQIQHLVSGPYIIYMADTFNEDPRYVIQTALIPLHDIAMQCIVCSADNSEFGIRTNSLGYGPIVWDTDQ